MLHEVNWGWTLRHPVTAVRFALAEHLPRRVSRRVRDWVGGAEWLSGQNPSDGGWGG